VAPETLQRTVIWRTLAEGGSEYCSLLETRGGFSLRGTLIGVIGGRSPMLVQYDIRCDASWHTQEVAIRRWIGSDFATLSLAVDPSGVWRCLGDARDDLAQCVDIDLEITPATNTLPLRRLGLKVGEARNATAAWVRFPGLSVQPLSQTYTRLAPNRYRYQSATGFAAELDVDDLGLVIRYGDLWERLTSA
jgi:hypothetical protein